jgi:membrane protein DedA with SNARE-associated domain
MSNYLLSLIKNYGYFGMFLGMILEAVIVIIPSEAILATSGILASKKIFSIKYAFLTGLLGSVFCAIIIYFMGYFGGRSFINKYGKYFFMKEEDIIKSDSWFNKYGLISALIGRNIPIIRTLISLPIGIMHLSFPKFLVYTTLGSIPWTILFIYLGYTLGDNWIVIKTYLDLVKKPIKILILILILYFLSKNYKKSTKNGHISRKNN